MPTLEVLKGFIGGKKAVPVTALKNPMECPACSGNKRIHLSGQRIKIDGSFIVPVRDCGVCVDGKVERVSKIGF
ncbi:MAG: hypothetical protein RLZZ283_212 [Candidatus Parcubacteria bacterium]|jgi:hypothetical protein